MSFLLIISQRFTREGLEMLYLRKLLKCILKKRNTARQERQASSLTECLLKEPSEKDPNKYRTSSLIVITTTIMLVVFAWKFQYYNENKGEDIAFPSLDSDAGLDHLENLPMCHINTTFGKTPINKLLAKNVLEHIYPAVRRGGYYIPNDCRARHKVGILVPYRDRALHLRIFLYNIHPFLMRQKLQYRIFIIEQAGIEVFNRGRLFNAGFKEMMKLGEWHCVVFHDVDLLPLDDRILYTCPIWPRNMCGKIVEETRPKFRTLYGGVSVIDVKHFSKVNGYSNYYWGWGGEDDDIFRRLQDAGFPVTKYDSNIAHYTSLRHVRQLPNKNRYKLLKTAIKRYKKEGLSTLKYIVQSVTRHHLYTHILIDINPNKESIQEIFFK